MSLVQRATDAAATMTRQQRQSGCVAYDASVSTGPYNYQPSEAAGIIFSIIFILSLFAHTFQFIYTRKLFYGVFSVAVLGEAIGWVARTYSHWCPYNSIAYSAQITSLILAPCYFSAGLYYALSQLITLWGRQYSPLPPVWYLVLFIGGDITSIIIQAVGGGIASNAADSTPPKSTALGTHIMLAGIIFQLVSMCVFATLWIWVVVRARKSPTWYEMRIVIFSISVATFNILLRNLYRSIELGEGWDGYLLSHEIFFDLLDGALMASTALTLNTMHPAFIIPKDPENHGFKKQNDYPVQPPWSPPLQKV